MENPANKNRLSPAFTGWVIGGLFVGMLILLFWPAPKDAPAPPPPVIERPPSELTKVGLPDDPDLEGLPGFFAIWADYAEWKDDKTIFAYRHPVSGEYSYFFEARRTPEGFRFRPVRRPTGEELEDPLVPNIPIRFFRPPGPPVRDLFRVGPEPPPNTPPPNLRVDMGPLMVPLPEVETEPPKR